MGFAERLRQYREEKGISQKDLSLQIGKSKNAISNYENHVSTPKIEDVIKIVEVLDIEPNMLYWDDIPEAMRKRISDRAVNTAYDNLNGLGKKKADDYIKDLAGNPLYIRKVKTIAEDISSEAAAAFKSNTSIR